MILREIYSESKIIWKRINKDIIKSIVSRSDNDDVVKTKTRFVVKQKVKDNVK